jgi:hypothetical protein
MRSLSPIARFDELLPIFASAPRKEGGLALDPARLAPCIAFAFAVLAGFTLCGLPASFRVLGVVRATLTGLLLVLPAAGILAASSAVPADRPLLMQAVLFSGMGLRAVSSAAAFTGCLIAVNASAVRSGALGSVNGLGQAVSSLVRATGPMMGGILWAAAAGMGPGSWVPPQYLPFAAVAGVGLATAGIYVGLTLPS